MARKTKKPIDVGAEVINFKDFKNKKKEALPTIEEQDKEVKEVSSGAIMTDLANYINLFETDGINTKSFRTMKEIIEAIIINDPDGLEEELEQIQEMYVLAEKLLYLKDNFPGIYEMFKIENKGKLESALAFVIDLLNKGYFTE